MSKLPNIPTRDKFMGLCTKCTMPVAGMRLPDGAEDADGNPIRVACIPTVDVIASAKLGQPWSGDEKKHPLHMRICGTILPPPEDPSDDEPDLSPPIPMRLPARAPEQPAQPSGNAGNGGGLGGGSGLSLLVGKPTIPAPGNDGTKADHAAGR